MLRNDVTFCVIAYVNRNTAPYILASPNKFHSSVEDGRSSSCFGIGEPVKWERSMLANWTSNDAAARH